MPSLSTANVCVRFAPSPTGFMHLGSLRTALYNYLFARKHNGTFLLRIEDTDQSRCVPSAVDSIVDTLKWSGLNYDVGPIYQSSRFKLYNDKVFELIEKKAAYRCFCSQHRLDLLRKEAAKNREKPRYDRRCYELSKSEIEEKLSKKVPFTVRFKLEDEDITFNDMVFGRH
ncbi:putative glutamate--tRNA ligase-like protein, partial [Leptotrombidium deliense]